MNTPVSVLVPTYNAGHLLPETLDCILSQAYAAAEVIVVDDGSTDNTKEVVSSFGKHIRYHYTANAGVCHARNLAASLASSDHFAFCDSDDLWRRDKLSQQMSLHDNNPDLQYSFTNFTHIVNGVQRNRTKFEDAPSGSFLNGLGSGNIPVIYHYPLYESLLSFQPIWPSTVMITRPLFEKIGGFREELGRNPAEDIEFSLRCVQHIPVGIIREPVVSVRRHDSNFSRDYEKNTRGEIEVLEHALKRHSITHSVRETVIHQIALRRVESSHGAFQQGHFGQVVSLLSPLPHRYLDMKAELKLFISKQSSTVARLMRQLLVKG